MESVKSVSVAPEVQKGGSWGQRKSKSEVKASSMFLRPRTFGSSKFLRPRIFVANEKLTVSRGNV